tara:strand:+ start:4886 stop:5920 length:1035 start_codon:yes stop_codon:yes gene_type:complete
MSNSSNELFENKIISKIKKLKLNKNIFNKIPPFQLIILGVIIIILILYFGSVIIYNILRDRSNGALVKLFELNKMPFINMVVNTDNYICFYSKYLNKHYPEMIDTSTSGDNEYKIKSSFNLYSSDPHNHTYCMFLYVNRGESSLTNYITDNIPKNTCKSTEIGVLENSFDSLDKNQQLLFSRGMFDNCYPMIYFDKNYKLKALFRKTLKTGTDISNNILLSDEIPFNEWIHLTITMNSNIINLYINGKLERTTNTERMNIDKYQNDTLKKLYLLNNKNNILQSGGFTGYLNYFNYYNKILNPDEIKNIYNNYLDDIKKLNKKVYKNQQKYNKDIYNNIKKTTPF